MSLALVPTSIRENIKDYQSALIAMGHCCMLNNAVEKGTAWDFFVHKIRGKEPYDELNFVRKDEGGAVVGSLQLDFKRNKIVTYFKGKQQEATFSSTLKNIIELEKIFAVVLERMANELPAITDQFTKAITGGAENAQAIEGKEKEANYQGYKLLIDGQEVIAVTNERVVLNRTSSIPLSQIRNIWHLFDGKFAEAICPLLGKQPNIGSLMLALRKIYLGRCLLGAKYALDGHTSYGQEAIRREFERIVAQIKEPGSVFHSMPIV